MFLDARTDSGSANWATPRFISPMTSTALSGLSTIARTSMDAVVWLSSSRMEFIIMDHTEPVSFAARDPASRPKISLTPPDTPRFAPAPATKSSATLATSSMPLIAWASTPSRMRNCCATRRATGPICAAPTQASTTMSGSHRTSPANWGTMFVFWSTMSRYVMFSSLSAAAPSAAASCALPLAYASAACCWRSETCWSLFRTVSSTVFWYSVPENARSWPHIAASCSSGVMSFQSPRAWAFSWSNRWYSWAKFTSVPVSLPWALSFAASVRADHDSPSVIPVRGSMRPWTSMAGTPRKSNPCSTTSRVNSSPSDTTPSSGSIPPTFRVAASSPATAPGMYSYGV